MGSESSPAGSIAPTPLTPNDARVHTVHARRVGAQRVFMLIDHLDLGGAQRHAGLVASHLAHSVHEVELAFTGQPDLRVDPSVRLISLAPRPVSRRADAAFEAASLTAAARFRPTIVHAHLFASAIAGYRVACRLGVPLVLSHHSTGTWRTDDDRRALAGPIAWAGHHFAASPEIRQQVIALGAAPDRVEFLANAVPVPEHPPARPPPSDTLRIGFLGRFSRDKDPVLVLQAMARLREQGVPARLEMRGGGELEPEVLAAVRSLALEEVVTLGGAGNGVGGVLRGSGRAVPSLPHRGHAAGRAGGDGSWGSGRRHPRGRGAPGGTGRRHGLADRAGRCRPPGRASGLAGTASRGAPGNEYGGSAAGRAGLLGRADVPAGGGGLRPAGVEGRLVRARRDPAGRCGPTTWQTWPASGSSQTTSCAVTT